MEKEKEKEKAKAAAAYPFELGLPKANIKRSGRASGGRKFWCRSSALPGQ